MTARIDDYRKRQYATRGFRAFLQLENALKRYADAFALALARWRAARALSRLDDVSLKDVGVPRGGIEGAVKEGRSTDR